MSKHDTIIIFDGHYIWGVNYHYGFQVTIPIDAATFYEAYDDIDDPDILQAILITLEAFNRQDAVVGAASRRYYG